MECLRQITYVIRQGDNLYNLAKHYQTTVNSILSLNPGIDPYNLIIGDTLVICPGENFIDHPVHQEGPPERQLMLSNQMREVWSQHVYWNRMLIISIAERLKDQNQVADRLLRNPGDIANVFGEFYSADAADKIAGLLTEHLQIGGALVTALAGKRMTEAENLNREWYINAEQMADAFSDINPYFNRNELRDMLFQHLDLTSHEASMRLAGDYQADIEAFDAIEQQVLMMADFFTSGLMRQFPQMFD